MSDEDNSNSDESIISEDNNKVAYNNIEKEENTKNNEISDSEIQELEQAIENIEVSEEITEDVTNNDSEEIEKTIEMEINETSDEPNVAEIKTVTSKEFKNNEMEPLDYNINFIDKIYDHIEKNKNIEKDNIDYEKIERLESMQSDIGSRVSRMMNKKRYKKKKSDE